MSFQEAFKIQFNLHPSDDAFLTEVFPGQSSLLHPLGSHIFNYEACEVRSSRERYEASVHTSKSTVKLVFAYKSVCWSGAP